MAKMTGTESTANTTDPFDHDLGFSDGISKLAAHALLEPILARPSLRLLCHEGEFEQLLAELALHQLGVVLAGLAPRAGR